ncbi:hypothetical protein [Paraflavitalea pollutisoli]|uniref:hypothetical protein n=1 Tax=Paraflavitalea pollutisoli TaxID=3034143 RepID=UPI0023EC40CC|nr:hypothetical protein [Paraflavitalea sp. H1-2-19X]
MAKLNEEFSFTGSIGKLSVYQMKGVDKPVVRRKGGPSKKKVSEGENFENTRRRNSEFGGRAAVSGWIMRALHHHKRLADYNIAGPLNVLMMPIQEMDMSTHRGQRPILLSANPEILKGFSLNRGTSFDTIVKTALEYRFEGNKASILIPALVPAINFSPSSRYPWFRIIVALGLVPDLIFMKGGLPIDPDYDSFSDPQSKRWRFSYEPAHPDYERFYGAPNEVGTSWFPVKKGMPSVMLDVDLGGVPPANDHTLILSVGIQYGNQLEIDVIEEAPYAGAAKILAVR